MLLIYAFKVDATTIKPMILYSGTPSKEFKEVFVKSLSQSLPEWKEISKFETDNPNCLRRKEYLIQFCLKGDQLEIVHQDKKALKRTLSKLIQMEKSGEIKNEADIAKAFQ
jgi:hypothetical protein